MSGLQRMPAALVAVAAAVVTAHGLVEVVVAAHVREPLAWAYPVITDGLALVAYRATGRLDDLGRRYAWVVVVIAAAVSGLAQAAYLASGALSEAPAWLRAGVGAWPAIAAAVAAHLLHLLVDVSAPAETEAIRSTDTSSTELVASVDTHLSGAPGELAEIRAGDNASGTEPAETTESVGEEPTPDGVDPRVRDLAADLASGLDITGEQAGARYGLSERSGRRLVGQARAHLEAAAPRAAPGGRPTTALHLVGRTGTP